MDKSLSDDRWRARWRRVARGTSVFVLLTGTLVLLGWAFHLRILVQGIPGLVAMTPCAAVAFVLVGLSLALQTIPPWPATTILTRAAAALTALLGLATIGEYLGLDLCVEGLFFADPEHLTGVFPGRMAPVTALCFLFVCVALLLTSVKRARPVSETLALVVLLAAFLFIADYAHGSLGLRWLGAYKGMALHTAVAFLAAAVGLLTVAPGAFTTLLGSDTAGGVLARTALPLAAVMPMAVGAAESAATRIAGLSASVVGAFDVVADTAAMVALLVFAAVRLRAADEKRARADENTRKLSRAVDQSPISVVITDRAGRIEFVNPKFEEASGYTLAEALGRTPRILKSGKQPPSVYEDLWKTISSGREWRGELCNRRKDGTLYWEFATISPVKDAEGDITHFVGLKEDVTERKRVEASLAASEQRYHALLDGSTEGIFESTPEGRFLAANPALARMLGYASADELMEKVTDIGNQLWVDPASRPAILERLVRDGAISSVEVPLRRKDGTTTWARLSAVAVKDEADALVRIQGMVEDVTERRSTECALRESEERFRTLSEATWEGIFIHDAGKILEVNRSTLELVALPRDEVIGRSVLDFVAPEHRATAMQRLMTPTDDPYEIIVVRGDGTRFAAEIQAKSLRFQDRTMRVVALRDVVERKRAEEARRREEERYRALFSENPMPMWAYDPQTMAIVAANEAAALQYGYPVAELASMTLADLRPAEELDRLRAEMESPGPKQGFVGTWKHRKKDGTLIDVDVHLNEVELLGRHLRLAVLHDVSHRTRLEDQFRQAQKMEAVGRLAGGVAHDFNNLLTVINGYASLLLGKSEPGSPDREPLTEIASAGDRAAALTRQLLAFSRKQVLVPQVVDLNEIITNTQKMLRRLIGEDVDLVAILAPELPPVKVDPAQVEQVIMNLAVNARDAMPQGGRLTVETRETELDALHDLLGVPSGRYVVVSVADNGVGMGPEVRAHLFEPFFTTKEQGKGTGLGLATVFGIVRQSGGSIAVRSEPGKGSTFDVYFPATKEGAGKRGKTASASLSLKGYETILLVEDDAGVRSLARAALDARGYEVLAVENADEAAETAAAFGGRIDLLLTDVVMPGGSGPDLAERLATSRPEMKVLFVSGYSDDAVARHGVLSPEAAFLEKPFTPHILAIKVRQVLGSAPSSPPR